MNVVDQPITKGDSFSLEGDLNANMTDWKVRCEIYDDCGNCIKLATENSGGSDDEIEITDAANGLFIINIAKDYHADVCENEECVVFEKRMPKLNVDFGIIAGSKISSIDFEHFKYGFSHDPSLWG